MSPAARRRLRFGFTTGACTAAAAKAACLALLGGFPRRVEIPFPDGRRHAFAVLDCRRLAPDLAQASVVKDAGDDPDVTNGAEIVARLERRGGGAFDLRFAAGEGVGTISKPGLPLAVGEPAINPGPRAMIRAALEEALAGEPAPGLFTVRVSVPRGRELAKKTLNGRLGIEGGLSILGTTGIVSPLSAAAWTATILASMSVARAVGCDTVVLSTGRTSERAVQERLELPVEAYAMMGDHLHFSLTAAREQGFSRIVLAGMWAKLVKAALAIPQTHVWHGALETGKAAELLGSLACDPGLAGELAPANTVREIYDRLVASGRDDLVRAVCERARRYAEEVSGLPVAVYLVTGPGQVACHV